MDSNIKKKVERKRDVRLDIVRIVALLCVISVHFFLNNGFYSNEVTGIRMYVMTLMRTSFMVCVPLFIILTGYLMRKKELSKKYYLGIVKTLGIYVLASLACLLFKIIVLDQSFNIFQILMGIFNFSLANYSWYIEMYIGLFLLIPFLNLIYNNLGSKKHKIVLICTMLFLTSLPTIVNIYNFRLGFSADMFFNDGELRNKILPFWWKSMYPVTYYFIGAYFSEYKPKIDRKLNILLLAIVILLFGSYNYFCSYGMKFVWGPYQDWGAIQIVILTVLVFMFILSFKCENVSSSSRVVLAKISDLCLGAYLVSSIFDKSFYTLLNRYVPVMTDRLFYFPIMVILVFVCSIVLSFILNCTYNFIAKFFSACKRKIRLKKFGQNFAINFDLVTLKRAFLYILLLLLIVCNFKIVVSFVGNDINNNVGNTFNYYMDRYKMFEYKDVNFVFDKGGNIYLSVLSDDSKLAFVKEKESFNYIHGVFKKKEQFEIRNDFGINAYKFDEGDVIDVYGIDIKSNFVFLIKMDDGYKYIDYNSIYNDKNLSFRTLALSDFSDIYFVSEKGIFVKDSDGKEKNVSSLFDIDL